LAEQTLPERLQRCSEWPSRFGPEEWSLYSRVMSVCRERNIPFAIGGALAALTYAGGWRDTKDLDIYAAKQDLDGLVQILSDAGFQDYFSILPYDRRWIYRAQKGDIIVDVIWAMANQRARVDSSWLCGPEVEVADERLRLLAPEYSLWSKLYVLERDRCDWPDCLKILYGVGPEIDWSKLLANVGADLPALAGLVSVFGWMAPRRAREFPPFVWERLHLQPPTEEIDESVVRERISFLNTRPWFFRLQNSHQQPGELRGAQAC
jgi:hypothetical protein